MTNMTHIEVQDAQQSTIVKTGQLLPIVKRTAQYFFARTRCGGVLQINAKTGQGSNVDYGDGKGWRYSGKHRPIFNIPQDNDE